MGKNTDGHSGDDGRIKQQPAASFESHDMTGCSLEQPAGSRIAYFLLTPYSFIFGHCDSHQAFGAGLDSCIVRMGRFIDEQIILSALQIQVGGKSFLLVVQRFPISQIPSCTHIGCPETAIPK